MSDLQACLPEQLRGDETRITPIAAGLSGAGVYRVEAGGAAYVLKISADESWRVKLQIQQRAAEAGLAPKVVHVDEARRAVLSAFVVDRSFPALYWNPQTREGALELLGRTLRTLHELPIPAGSTVRDGRDFLSTLWSERLEGTALPGFVGDAVQRVLDERPPASDRAKVLSHNDVNPTNFVFDGEALRLLDWETAGPNDPFFDLATVSVFLRMDEATCAKLLAIHDRAPVAELPPRLAYFRRLTALLPGIAFLRIAAKAGHPGANGDESLETTTSLADCYAQLRTGALVVASPAGQWQLGLALVKTSAGL